MYNEKNEMQKVNFGDLPANFDDDIEFAEEWYEEHAEQPNVQKYQIKNNKAVSPKNNQYE